VRRPPADRGSVSIELAILLPGFIALTLLAVMFGRETIAQSAVDLAAHDAARAASLARTAAQAAADGEAAARSTLDARNAACDVLSVSIDTTGFAVPAGTPAQVTATVSCVVPLSDLSLPGMPGSFTMTSTFTSPLDTYRSRT